MRGQQGEGEGSMCSGTAQCQSEKTGVGDAYGAFPDSRPWVKEGDEGRWMWAGRSKAEGRRGKQVEERWDIGADY